MFQQSKSVKEWIEFFINTALPQLTQDEANLIANVLTWDSEKKAGFMFAKQMFEEGDDEMDKQIRKTEKDVKKVGAELKHLEKADKKRDKLVDAGKDAMKKKC